MQPKTPLLQEHQMDESDDEDEDVDDVLYKEEDDGSEISSDNDRYVMLSEVYS